MKNKILAMMVLSVFLLTACGGSDDDASGTGTGTGTSVGIKENRKLIEEITGIVLREAAVDGLMDSLIYGSDMVADGEKCSSGSYTVTNNVITFKDCVGIIDESGIANGVIDTNKGIEAKNLVIKYGNNESDTLNGKLTIEESATSVKVTSSELTVVSQTLSSTNQPLAVNYALTGYQLTWTRQDASNVNIQVSGKLVATGGEWGDYKIAFDTTAKPLYLKIDADENVTSYPYAGTVMISDLNNTATSIVVSVINDQTAQFKATVDGKGFFDEVVKWDDMFGY